MSKYTTMVKNICEEKFLYRPNPAAPDLLCPAELTPYWKKYTDDSGDYYKIEHSVGARGVDCVLAYSWDKIFKTTPPEGFYNNTHYPVICRKILKHYYMREIACETAGIWMLWMNERMENIAPFYGGMYKSAQFEFDPFGDVNLTRHHTLDNNGASVQDDIAGTTIADTSHDTGTNTTDTSGTTLHADTPQGSISSPIFNSYLTDARKDTSNSSTDVDMTNRYDSRKDDTLHSEKGYTDNRVFDETLVGKRGFKTYSEMLQEYRKTILNIDKDIINEFKDLFFMLW